MDVAQIAWWRDGRPIDNDEEVVWGYMYVSLTPAVRTQLELPTEPLQVDAYVRRDCEQESGQTHGDSKDLALMVNSVSWQRPMR